MNGLTLTLPLGQLNRKYANRMPTFGERLNRPGQPSTGEEREAALVERLRAGDESAFSELVDQLGPSMLRVARIYVRDRAAAEEVVQEAWLGVLNGIDRFEGRSSLKTWIFRILTNRAKTRGEREARSLPFSALATADHELAVDPERFLNPEQPELPSPWAAPPRNWPHERVLEREALGVVQAAIMELPDSQREVIRLRDVEGWSADEVTSALEISDVNQRVLLHRARSKVRSAIESYIDPEPGS